jgi:small subunit ribosomal protein S21
MDRGSARRLPVAPAGAAAAPLQWACGRVACLAHFTVPPPSEEAKSLVIKVQVRPNESLEAALRRFKRQCNYSGVFRLAKAHTWHEKRSDKLRRERRERLRTIQRASRLSREAASGRVQKLKPRKPKRPGRR